MREGGREGGGGGGGGERERGRGGGREGERDGGRVGGREGGREGGKDTEEDKTERGGGEKNERGIQYTHKQTQVTSAKFPELEECTIQHSMYTDSYYINQWIYIYMWSIEAGHSSASHKTRDTHTAQ